ncbi:hypothetical protein TVAG_295360 [Trichomonas vaginalis G3]|uniref:Ubiquitin-like domain-containing protein n=1 Tax=Trichomonas vaginalis (strain ATCC PRA-98 / G3) TaxID=412133 RepID=A2DL92_TRIV3|nr:ubiquitin-like family [Trichomonas vaginalis G3]EAY18883.1 hypothetical protein TVAG_295360 [Trichomonas vaginalis G3]KAI5525998.1 ubiquitin-like family [Trichomonas vaginalis G3]|eukprot:XP_001579869.1 hypothetical protein [Trichomonas vaginalis G3]
MNKSPSALLSGKSSKNQFNFPDQLILPIPASSSPKRPERLTSRPPSGILYIHFLDNPEFEIEFFEEEPIKSLKLRIAHFAKADLSNFNLSSRNGTLNIGKKVSDYGIRASSHIIVLENQAHRNHQIKLREEWIENRKQRRSLGRLNISAKFLSNLNHRNNIKLQIAEKDKDMQLYKSVETFFNEINQDMF